MGVTLRVWYTLFECVSDGGRGGYVGECLTSFFLPWLTFQSQPGGFTSTIFIRNSYFSGVTKVMNFWIRQRNNLAHILQEKYTCKNNGTLKSITIEFQSSGAQCVYGYRVWGTCNNRTMVPHKEIQWNNGTPQGKLYRLATKEKTIKYPTSAMCRVWVCA